MSILKALLEAESAWDDQDTPPKPPNVEEFLEPALEEVVETIMLFGEYPQPLKKRRHRPDTGNSTKKEFDLHDFLASKDEPGEQELLEYYVASITDHTRNRHSSYDTFTTLRAGEVKKVDKLLTEHLRGSAIVRARAEEIAKEAENE